MEKYLKSSPLTFGISVLFVILAASMTLFFDQEKIVLASSICMIYPVTVFCFNFALMVKSLLFPKKG